MDNKDRWDDPKERKHDADNVAYPEVLHRLAAYWGVPYDSKFALEAYVRALSGY